jgi:hypothetical protein
MFDRVLIVMVLRPKDTNQKVVDGEKLKNPQMNLRRQMRHQVRHNKLQLQSI